MEDILALSKQAYRSFWNKWALRDPESFLALKTTIDPGFNGFGSNIDEVWASDVDLFSQHDKEQSQIPEPYSIAFNWTEASGINQDSAVVYGVVSIRIKIDKKVVILENVRNTFVFQKVGKDLKVKHWHCSLPDMGVSGEVVPGALEPRRYDQVSVLFCDFVNFTKTVATVAPKKIFNELSDIYQNFDELIEKENLEKIQVYGDGYLAVGGLSEQSNRHASECVRTAKTILAFLKQRNETSEFKWDARIGIHSGPLIAGVIGERKFSFNIFGDTVNTASRVETASIPNRINISQSTYELVKDDFRCTYRGKIGAKGKGEMDMYFVE